MGGRSDAESIIAEATLDALSSGEVGRDEMSRGGETAGRERESLTTRQNGRTRHTMEAAVV